MKTSYGDAEEESIMHQLLRICQITVPSTRVPPSKRTRAQIILKVYRYVVLLWTEKEAETPTCLKDFVSYEQAFEKIINCWYTVNPEIFGVKIFSDTSKNPKIKNTKIFLLRNRCF